MSIFLARYIAFFLYQSKRDQDAYTYDINYRAFTGESDPTLESYGKTSIYGLYACSVVKILSFKEFGEHWLTNKLVHNKSKLHRCVVIICLLLL